MFQAANRVIPPQPPNEDPTQRYSEAIREAARNLKKVEIRVENNVIIIDD